MSESPTTSPTPPPSVNTYECKCGQSAGMLIIHECRHKRILGTCTGARATCSAHLAADLIGELAIAELHRPQDSEERGVKVRSVQG